MRDDSIGTASIKKNFLWKFLERVGVQVFSFIVSIILARVIDPNTYGQIALVTIFTSILNVFVDSGLGTALIQKKDADEIDFSTVFFFNIVFCVFLYGMLFLFAPVIADFYNNYELTIVIRVLGLMLVISGVKNIQIAYVSKNMIFKKFFFSTLGGTIVSSIVGIILAILGKGIWALVFLNLVNNFIDTLILWITVGWYPKFVFSFSRLKKLLRFSINILITNLINTVYNNIEQLFIGKKYDSASLAYYNKGYSFPSLISTTVDSSLQSVLFPALSNIQESKQAIKNMMIKSINIITYVMFPLLVGLGVCGNNFITLLITDKWIPCLQYLYIFCFIFMFVSVNGIKMNAIKAIGNSRLCLILDSVSKLMALLILIFTMRISVFAIAIGSLSLFFLNFIILLVVSKKIFNYGIWEQCKDIFINFTLAVIMGICVYAMNYIPIDYRIVLFLQVLSGIFIYVLLSFLFRKDNLRMFVSLIFKH